MYDIKQASVSRYNKIKDLWFKEKVKWTYTSETFTISTKIIFLFEQHIFLTI